MEAEYKLESKTTKTPHTSPLQASYCVFCEYFGEIWMCYNTTTLYNYYFCEDLLSVYRYHSLYSTYNYKKNIHRLFNRVL